MKKRSKVYLTCSQILILLSHFLEAEELALTTNYAVDNEK